MYHKRFKNLGFVSILSAILATSCCLPPLLFLFFGISIGSLTFLEYLEPFRYIFTPISIIAFLLFIYYQKCSSCGYSKLEKIKYTLFFLLIIALLTYPEFLVIFIGD